MTTKWYIHNLDSQWIYMLILLSQKQGISALDLQKHIFPSDSSPMKSTFPWILVTFCIRRCAKAVSRRFVSYELLSFVIVYVMTLHPWKRTLHGWTALYVNLTVTKTRNKCMRSTEAHFSIRQFTHEEYVSMDATSLRKLLPWCTAFHPLKREGEINILEWQMSTTINMFISWKNGCLNHFLKYLKNKFNVL
jgi:hypothetical protein